MPRGRLEEIRVWVPPELYERILRDAAVRKSSISGCVRDRLELCYEIESDWADALEAVPAPGKEGAVELRHRILDAMEERIASTLEVHEVRQLEFGKNVERVASMLDHLAYWLFVLLPHPKRREAEARQAQGQESHERWRKGVRGLIVSGGPREDAR